MNNKPSVDSIIAGLRASIPNCSINDDEVQAFKKLYELSSTKSLSRVYHQAVNNKAMQPVSYMNRQLRIIKPESDPFNPAISNKSFKSGTDWQSKYAAIEQKRLAEEQNYDRQHGKGAWLSKDKREKEALHNFFVKLELTEEK